MNNNSKRIDNFFDSQIGHEFLEASERIVEEGLRNQAIKDVLKISYTKLPYHITYISLSGEMFKATRQEEHDSFFEKAVQSNLEYFKKCLAYKWSK